MALNDYTVTVRCTIERSFPVSAESAEQAIACVRHGDADCENMDLIKTHWSTAKAMKYELK